MDASQDMLFDTEQLAREAVAATPWEGRCPLRYTTDFYTPAELDAALARWNGEYGNFGSYPFSHMLNRPDFGGDSDIWFRPR